MSNTENFQSEDVASDIVCESTAYFCFLEMFDNVETGDIISQKNLK
jgi:hypothetical protein